MKPRRVLICRNERQVESKPVVISENLNFRTFLQVSGDKVGVRNATRAFLANGTEIFTLNQIQDEDSLYISTGEDFFGNNHALKSTGITIAVLGSGGVGKSALTLRFIRDIFVKDWDPTIEDGYKKTIRVDDEAVLLNIIDTAGQEDFKSLRSGWVEDKDAYLLVFSLTDGSSVQILHEYIDLIEQCCTSNGFVPPIMIVGNKKDLTGNRIISNAAVDDVMDHAKRICRSIMDQEGSVRYMETSALDGDNVSDVFVELVKEFRITTKNDDRDSGKSSSWCWLW